MSSKVNRLHNKEIWNWMEETRVWQGKPTGSAVTYWRQFQDCYSPLRRRLWSLQPADRLCKVDLWVCLEDWCLVAFSSLWPLGIHTQENNFLILTVFKNNLMFFKVLQYCRRWQTVYIFLPSKTTVNDFLWRWNCALFIRLSYFTLLVIHFTNLLRGMVAMRKVKDLDYSSTSYELLTLFFDQLGFYSIIFNSVKHQRRKQARFYLKACKCIILNDLLQMRWG